MKPMADLDYVTLYAERLKEDNALFAQQKNLIDSQLVASSSLFRRIFSGDFKLKAREHLKSIGVLK